MASPMDTEDWKIAAYIDWQPKRPHKEVDCERCHGIGTIGGGFKSFGDPETCPSCYGKKFFTVPDVSTPKPEIPKDLIEHMRNAFKEYCEQYKLKQENKEKVD